MEKITNNKSLSRRKFLTASGLTSTALLLGFYFPAGAKNGKVVNGDDTETDGIEMNAWVIIDTSGKVTLVSHRAEMGQGVYQAIPQIIAEELEVNLKNVNVIFAQGDQKKYGSQITGGSSSIRDSYKNLLQLSATARVMLMQAAANKWSVNANECYAEDGNIIHKSSGKKMHYGELVVAASKLKAPENVTLKKRSDYKLIGKPLNRKDTPLKTNGTAVFGLDKKLPGMLYASVERNPRLRGVVKSYDDTVALKVPGVKKVFKVTMKVFNTNREGVAVVATSTWAAMQGRKVLKVDWDDTGFEHINTTDIYQRHEAELKKDGLVFKTQGDANNIISNANKKVDVIYQTPYESHSAMEPLNCVANYQDDKIEIWGPIQAPDWVQSFISSEFKMPVEKVIVNMTFLGGGFGRKAFLDYPHEAVLISKEIKAPVQVVWTREDDMTQGPFRPGMSYRCEGVINNGEIEAFRMRLCGQNMDNWQDGADKTKANGSSAEGFLKPYLTSIKNLEIQDVPFDTPVPIMWWRSVYASTNGFAYESFMDELAHEAGMDPLDFRRQYLKEERLQKQIDKLEEVSGWKNRKKNEGYGVAITECFASTVGQVVKVSKDENNAIKIEKVWAVMDCGWYVNPDIIKAQVEGSIMMALGAATIHEITFKDGLAEQKNFYNYQMPRITDIPQIEIYVMENDEDAGGVGEPGLPAFTPALTNAIYDLTGKRIRKLPFSLNEV